MFDLYKSTKKYNTKDIFMIYFICPTTYRINGPKTISLEKQIKTNDMNTVTYSGELFVNEQRMKNNNIDTGVWYYFDKNGKKRELNNWNLIHICDKLLIGEKPITKEKEL